MQSRSLQFPKYPTDFGNPRSQPISGPTGLPAEADPESSPVPREQRELKRSMAITKPTAIKALASWCKHRSDGWGNGLQSPSHQLSSLAVLPRFLREQTGNGEILPSVPLLNTLKYQWRESTQSNTQGKSVPTLLRDTCNSLPIRPQLEGRAQLRSVLGYSPPWRCKIRRVQVHDGTRAVWS